MKSSTQQFVYHGSHKAFKIAKPKRQLRSRTNNQTGKQETIFDEISFHATPHRWIALAYIYARKPYKMDGKTAHYNIGIDLYKHRKNLLILGFESLEKSLEKLYGDGGYLMTFDAKDFHNAEGLGKLEVICKQPIKPLRIERIEDPVKELQKEGVSFEFDDLANPENEYRRNYG